MKIGTGIKWFVFRSYFERTVKESTCFSWLDTSIGFYNISLHVVLIGLKRMWGEVFSGIKAVKAFTWVVSKISSTDYIKMQQ
jgi:hypothetical protein